MSSLSLSRSMTAQGNKTGLLAALLRRPVTWAMLVTLLAFFLRAWNLEGVPPGWRDDELIETLVISQKILDGDLSFYYPDASGHEALYHVLNALFLAWFGPTGYGIRLLSAFLGTLTVPLTYVLARRMFGPAVGLTAAALLAVSFWGLMYSRVGIRHVLTPPLALVAFYCFWRGITAIDSGRWSTTRFALAGLFLGLGFHSYFASRGAPLIPVAFLVYVALAAPSLYRRHWRGLVVMAAAAAVVAMPLALAVAQQPEAEARVGELALPLIEARAGDYGLIIEHAVAALVMPHSGGDPEWLYNVPGRPVFSPLVAVSFWIGVALALGQALAALARRLRRPRPEAGRIALASAFLLIWWLAGISPAVLSVPPASLGHVILAQPAFVILAALPVGALAGWRRIAAQERSVLAIALAVALVAVTAARDLQAYFGEWPQRGMVRFLYRADIEDVARFVLRDPAAPWPGDFGITGLLAGPWDRVALDLALAEHPEVRPRWYNPERALLLWPDVSFSGYPAVESPFAAIYEPLAGGGTLTGGYRLTRVAPPAGPTLTNGQVFLNEAPQCFTNGLCWTAAAYDPASGQLELVWRAEDELDLPEMPLISNPPPPGVYSGPRLYVFAQLIDENGAFLVGDDGLWVDPLTLRAGDVFAQRHRLPAPEGAAPSVVLFGLYDPMTGDRILTTDGRDHIRLELVAE